MQILMEVFYLRLIDDVVWYQRKQIDLNYKSADPTALIQQNGQTDFVVHSTSWRYVQPSKVMLTYIAYSDELEFGKGKVEKLPLQQLKKINVSTGSPRSKKGLERQVVAHAMRHISFLIKTDYGQEFKDAFTPRSRRVFKSLWSALAGRLAF
jgi:hypothetical protein